MLEMFLSSSLFDPGVLSWLSTLRFADCWDLPGGELQEESPTSEYSSRLGLFTGPSLPVHGFNQELECIPIKATNNPSKISDHHCNSNYMLVLEEFVTQN